MKTNIIILVLFINYISRADLCLEYVPLGTNMDVIFLAELQRLECTSQIVKGSLTIQRNPKLTHVQFENLGTIESDLIIDQNPLLESIIFCMLKVVQGITFTSNPAVTEALYCELNVAPYPALDAPDSSVYLCPPNHFCKPSVAPTPAPTPAPTRAPTRNPGSPPISSQSPTRSPFKNPTRFSTPTILQAVTQKQTDTSGSLVLIIIGVVILLLIAGYAGYHFWRKTHGMISQKIAEDTVKKGIRAKEAEKEQKKQNEKQEKLDMLQWERIEANDMEISDQVCKNYAAVLESTQELVYMDLSNSNFSENGLKMILQRFELNETVITLKLANLTCFKEEGAKQMAAALSANDTLQELDLRENDIDDKSLAYIAEALEENAELKKLDLRMNKISHVGLDQLAASLKKNPHTQLNEILLNKGNTFDQNEYEDWCKKVSEYITLHTA